MTSLRMLTGTHGMAGLEAWFGAASDAAEDVEPLSLASDDLPLVANEGGAVQIFLGKAGAEHGCAR